MNSDVPRKFFGGWGCKPGIFSECSTNSVENGGQRERRSRGGSHFFFFFFFFYYYYYYYYYWTPVASTLEVLQPVGLFYEPGLYCQEPPTPSTTRETSSRERGNYR
jgi:hypothetical protein